MPKDPCSIHTFGPLIRMRTHFAGALLLAAVTMMHSARGASPPSAAFLQKYCAPCHGSARQPQGGLDLTKLAFTPENADNFATWVKVHDRVSAGEMPPAGLPRPDANALVGRD